MSSSSFWQYFCCIVLPLVECVSLERLLNTDNAGSTFIYVICPLLKKNQKNWRAWGALDGWPVITYRVVWSGRTIPTPADQWPGIEKRRQRRERLRGRWGRKAQKMWQIGGIPSRSRSLHYHCTFSIIHFPQLIMRVKETIIRERFGGFLRFSALLSDACNS